MWQEKRNLILMCISSVSGVVNIFLLFSSFTLTCCELPVDFLFTFFNQSIPILGAPFNYYLITIDDLIFFIMFFPSVDKEVTDFGF